jgi:putative transposase
MDEAARKAAEAATQDEVEDHERDLLGRKKGEHRNYNDGTRVDVECRKCGTHQRVMFCRDGTWPRFLATLYGVICLHLTRIRCDCGGFVSVCYPGFTPYARRHEGLQRRIYGLMGMGLSLRQVRLSLGADGIRISAATVAKELGVVADRSQEQFGKGNAAPGVVLLDAIWVWMAEETGAKVTNTRNQQRPQKKVKKKPLLVAWGIWPDTGKAALIGWMVGDREDTGSWQGFLEHLLERGVKAEHGLRQFVHDGSKGLEAASGIVSFGRVRWQRCVFHKVKNALDAVKGDPEVPKQRKRQHKKGRRGEVAQDLAAIWVAPTEEDARQREREFRAKWQEKEPEVVATLENDFDATLTFYRVQAEVEAETGQRWAARFLRTTSPLERKNRTIRAKARGSSIFQSERGLQGAAHLALDCRGTADPIVLATRLSTLTRQVRALPRKPRAPVST